MGIHEERLTETFLELVQIDSETKNEGSIQPYLKEKFKEIGLTVVEDNAKEETGFGANNLFCTLDGDTNIPAIFFSCHMDTVTPGKGIKPVVKDGYIYSDGTTILGADDKAGIAVLLELARTLKESKVPHGKVEFVISVGEESGLVGAKAFDVNQMESKLGFVLDTGGPVGAITIGSPVKYRIETVVQGISAHAGVAPEKGVSAAEIAARAISQMRLGRIDGHTTANIGMIAGGTATNVVMDRLSIISEVRSLSSEACEQQVAHMKTVFEETATEMGGSVLFEAEKQYGNYVFDESTRVVQIAAKALSSIGREPRMEMTGGGSDANIFNQKGIETTNLSVGYEKIHTLNEYMPLEELNKALEMAVAIVRTVTNE